MKNKTENTATPYDDVHRTMLNDCPELIIPVVNEMFHRLWKDFHNLCYVKLIVM